VRICLYSEKVLPGRGGQECVVDRLARGFQEQGHAVVVLAPAGRGATRAEDARLPYPTVRHPRFRSTRWFLAAYGWWLARLHRCARLDIVHCHSVHPTGYVAARCAVLRDVPLVISSHGGDVDDASPLCRKPALAAHYRLALRRADALVAPSAFVEGRLRQWCEVEPRIERIGHGVDLPRYARAVARPAELEGRIEPGRYFLFLGRVVRRKGVDLLLEAFRQTAGEHAARLVIAGQGTGSPAARAAAARTGLADRVVFLPWVEGDVKTWLLQNALCNVVPSRHSEAFGLTAVESLASGRPVIAARVPGLCELITPGRNGLLVAPESADELAGALREAVGRPEWLDQLGLQARQDAQAFTWEKTIQRHLALFEELAGRGG